jgi:DNA repair exonuclease SbcCD ATPase subunit
MDELKECPFCGGDKFNIDRDMLSCHNCAAQLDTFGWEMPEVIEAWNSRAYDKKIEQLESELQELQKENARLEAKATNHHEMMLRAEGEKLVLMQENARLEGELDKHIRAEKALMVGNIINCDMMYPNDLTPAKPKG